jgi:hypothetical protein
VWQAALNIRLTACTIGCGLPQQKPSCRVRHWKALQAMRNRENSSHHSPLAGKLSVTQMRVHLKTKEM